MKMVVRATISQPEEHDLQYSFQKGLWELRKFPIRVMVWVGLTEFGATEPYFIEPGDKVDSNYYCLRILPHAKREGRRLFGHDKWVFQQDGATCHTSARSQGWCSRNLKHFLPKDKWPPNSPDLNPLDYYYWNAVVSRMDNRSDYTLDTYKAEIRRACQSIPTSEICSAVRAFGSRAKRIEQDHGQYLP
jgi:hypothetical protein